MLQKARSSDAPTSFWYKIFFKLSNKHKMGRTLLENVIKIIEIQFSEAHFKIEQLQSKISCLGALSCYTHALWIMTELSQISDSAKAWIISQQNEGDWWQEISLGPLPTWLLLTIPLPAPPSPLGFVVGKYTYCSTIDQSMRQRPATLFFRTGGQATVWENMCDKLEI